jgi:hypothetical protein
MEQKKIILFSSSYHVEEINKFLNALGSHPQATIDLIPLPTEEYKDVSKYDYVGFASGLWKWDYSRQVYDHLYKIYGLKGKLCFSFSITGSPLERRSYYLREPIEKQGGIFLGGLIGKGNLYNFMSNGTDEPDPDFIRDGKVFLSGVFNMDFRNYQNNNQLPNPMNPPMQQQSFYDVRTMGPQMGGTINNNMNNMGGNFNPNNMNNGQFNGQNMNGQGFNQGNINSGFDPNNPNNNMNNNNNNQFNNNPNGPYNQQMQMGGNYMNNPNNMQMGTNYMNNPNYMQMGGNYMNNNQGQYNQGGQYGYGNNYGGYGRDRFRELDPDVRLEAPPGWYDKEHLRLQASKEREKYFYNGEKDITEYQDKYISYVQNKNKNPY